VPAALFRECIASAKASGSKVTVDPDFARDVEQGINDRQHFNKD
jgi:hypothetical protein